MLQVIWRKTGKDGKVHGNQISGNGRYQTHKRMLGLQYLYLKTKTILELAFWKKENNSVSHHWSGFFLIANLFKNLNNWIIINTCTPACLCVCVCVCVTCSVVSSSQPTRLLCPWDSPGKNTGVGSYPLLQGIFLTQGSNLGLLHCRQILYYLSHQGSP